VRDQVLGIKPAPNSYPRIQPAEFVLDVRWYVSTEAGSRMIADPQKET